MIRVPITKDKLEALIKKKVPRWLARAKTKTTEIKKDSNLKITSIWSPIKPVYMTLQNSKCIYCEKEIEPQPIEQDVEHFRPKNNVKRWPVPRWMKEEEGIHVQQPQKGSENGYRLLAYHPLNYAAACKTCNSNCKRDYFPIAGSRRSRSKNPTRMRVEKAYLIYPLGDFDEDPEALIEFHGLSPQAKASRGFKRKRALVTIDLFKLDDTIGRKGLLRDRAKEIERLYFALRFSQSGNTNEADIGRRAVSRLINPGNGHTNCLKCFQKLFETNRTEADRIYNGVRAFLESISD